MWSSSKPQHFFQQAPLLSLETFTSPHDDSTVPLVNEPGLQVLNGPIGNIAHCWFSMKLKATHPGVASHFALQFSKAVAVGVAVADTLSELQRLNHNDAPSVGPHQPDSPSVGFTTRVHEASGAGGSGGAAGGEGGGVEGGEGGEGGEGVEGGDEGGPTRFRIS